MSDMKKVRYRLPVSRVRFSGSVTTVTDTALSGPGEPGTVTCHRAGDAKLVIAGDEPIHTLRIESGRFQEIEAEIGLSEHMLLTGVSAQSAGQLGEAVGTLLGVAATAIGIASGGGAGVVAATAGMMVRPFVRPDIARAKKAQGARTDEDLSYCGLLDLDPDVPAHLKAFCRYDASACEALITYRTALEGISLAHARLAAEAATSDDSAARRRSTVRLEELEHSVSRLRSGAARVQRQLSAWMAGQVSERTEHFQFELDIIGLPRSKEMEEMDPVAFPCSDGDATTSVSANAEWEEVWRTLGIMVSRSDESAPEFVSENQPHPSENVFLYREPESVALTFWRADGNGRPRRAGTLNALVTGDFCHTRSLEISQSRTGKRSITAEFGPTGGLTKLGAKSSASASDAANAVAAARTGVGDGLGAASSILDKVDKLSSAEGARVVAALKREKERKELEIALAGSAASTASQAELRELESEIAVLSNRTKHSEESRKLALERELAEVRLETERLKALTALRAAREESR